MEPLSRSIVRVLMLYQSTCDDELIPSALPERVTHQPNISYEFKRDTPNWMARWSKYRIYSLDILQKFHFKSIIIKYRPASFPPLRSQLCNRSHVNNLEDSFQQLTASESADMHEVSEEVKIAIEVWAKIWQCTANNSCQIYGRNLVVPRHLLKRIV